MSSLVSRIMLALLMFPAALVVYMVAAALVFEVLLPPAASPGKEALNFTLVGSL